MAKIIIILLIGNKNNFILQYLLNLIINNFIIPIRFIIYFINQIINKVMNDIIFVQFHLYFIYLIHYKQSLI